MATGIRKCKVCGKEYPYCKTITPSNKFRYQDVACSPTCGQIYFTRILESRGQLSPENKQPEPPVEKVDAVKDTEELTVIDIWEDDEDDDDFDDDLDNDDDDLYDDDDDFYEDM